MTAIRLRRLAHAEGLPLPALASPGSSGYDLRAAVHEPISVAPRARVLVPTGFVLELPAGWEGQVRPRSGLALRAGVTVLNAPGTIDSDYRGELQVLLANLGDEPFTIARGDRIAQLVLCRVENALFVEAADLSTSERGSGGFGSSGLS